MEFGGALPFVMHNNEPKMLSADAISEIRTANAQNKFLAGAPLGPRRKAYSTPQDVVAGQGPNF